MPSLFISAAHKSSGKTTVSIGLTAAFAHRNLNVQPFKKGPDYIDPIWLSMAAGNPCYNLDYFTSSRAETIDDYARRSQHSDLSIIEGNKGLYDGLDLDGSNSNAALAKSISAPVILVIDVRGTMRGIAPLLIGYETFDPDINIAGVITNMCGGARHESKLRAAVEHYTDIPFIGAIQKQDSLALTEQHLGLIPGNEDPTSIQKISHIRQAVEAQLDIDQLLNIAKSAKQPIVQDLTFPITKKEAFAGIRIGIAKDKAFGFYYPGDLEAMSQSGAILCPFDTLTDHSLPDIDALFIGGGFPERHASALQNNSKLRTEIKSKIDSGMPAYAECGGLMYLSKNISWKGKSFDMVGAIPGNTIMHDKPCGRGYVKLTENHDNSLWPQNTQSAATIKAHEFHYSSLVGLPESSHFAYDVERGTGIQNQKDGLVYKNLFASYAHLRHTTNTPWVNRFLTFVSDVKFSNQNNYLKAL
ncbi:MAG: cobyrinic acid a,c-diamide synthase [Polaribacter sp.]|jgi:cobyrinic acid a,c-diamide synthase